MARMNCTSLESRCENTTVRWLRKCGSAHLPRRDKSPQTKTRYGYTTLREREPEARRARAAAGHLSWRLPALRWKSFKPAAQVLIVPRKICTMRQMINPVRRAKERIRKSPTKLGDVLYADCKAPVPEQEWATLVQSIAAGNQLALHA